MREPKRRRSRMEIRAQILLAAVHETNPTNVMYATNLSWKPLVQIVGELADKGLITRRSTLNDRRRDKRTIEVLQTTQAGLMAVRDLNRQLKLFKMDPVSL